MKQQKHRLTLLISMLVITGLMVTGCASKTTPANVTTNHVKNEKKIEVIATLFPQYDFTKALAKDSANVRLLMPPGTEAHSYEPTPKDLVDIQNADVFIYTSIAMEPWVEKMLSQIGPKTLVIDATKGVKHLTAEEMGQPAHEEESHEESGHEHEGVDPHVWLDPANASIMAANVAEGLMKAMPNESDNISKALNTYLAELKQLDQDIENGLSKYKDKQIVFAGHYAFNYFSKRYGISYHSPYEGFSPDAEPAPQKIAQMIDFMKSENQKVVYYEELIDPKIARIIASESGAKLIMLHAAHNVSKDELNNQITYIEIMRENLSKLEEGLK